MSGSDLNSGFNFSTSHCVNRDQFLQSLGEIEKSKDLSDCDQRIAEFLKNNQEWITESDAELIGRVQVLSNEGQGDGVNRVARAGLFSEASVIAKAKASADNDAEGTAAGIREWGIKSPIARIEIARICADQSLECTAPHIANFDIPPEFQEELMELLELCAGQDANATVEHFADFKIASESDRISMIKKCLEEGASNIPENLQNMGIQDQTALVDLCMILAKRNVKRFLEHFARIPIKDPVDRVKIVKQCMDLDVNGTMDALQNAHLDDELLREVVKYGALKNGGAVLLVLGAFPTLGSEMRMLCAQSDPKNLMANISRDGHAAWGIPQEEFPAFQRACLASSLDVLESISQRFSVLFKKPATASELDQFLSEMASQIADEPMLEMLQRILKVESPFIKQGMAKWLMGALLLLEGLDVSARAWAVRSLGALAEMPSPQVRWELTSGLISACQEEARRIKADQLLSDKRLGALAIPLMELAEAGVDANILKSIESDVKRYVNQRDSKLRDGPQLRILLSTLHQLNTPRYFNRDQLETILKQIFLPQDEASVLKNLNAVRNILRMGDRDRLGHDEDFQTIMQGLFQELFSLQSFKGDLSEAMSKNIANEAHLNLLMSYASTLKTLKASNVMDCFSEVLQSILEGRFKELRYGFDHNPHLTKVFSGREELFKTWREPIQMGLSGPFHPSEWLENHLGDFQGLQSGDSRNVGMQMKGLKKGSPEQVRLKMQSLCIQMSKMTAQSDMKKLLSLLEGMREVMESGGEAFINTPFFEAVGQKIKDLQTEGLKVKLTDEPFDLLGAGSLPGSCLAVTNDAASSKGLLGIWRNGMTQMMGVYDSDGKLQSRCLLRVIFDDPQSNPVVLVEPMYPTDLPAQQKTALLHAAKMKADQMGLPLLSSEPSMRKYESPLRSIEGPAPYDYSDSAGGSACAQGVFTIHQAYYVDA